MAMVAALLLPSGRTAAAPVGNNVTIEKSVSSSTYSVEGQTITYTYTITNNSLFSFFDFVDVTDDQLGRFECLTDLPPGETDSCSRTYVITAADISNGSITNIAYATAYHTFGECSGDNFRPGYCNEDSATDSETITFVPPGNVTIVKNTTGGDATFTFSSFTSALAISLTTSGGTASSGAIPLPPGSHSITEDEVAGFNLTELVCSDPDNGTSVSLSSRRAVIDVDSGENITCTFTNQGTGTVTIIKTTGGADGTFTFASATAALAVSLTTSGGTASAGPIKLTPGSYSVSENVTAGFTLTGLACSDPDGGSSTDLASRTANIDLDAGENIVCTFTNGSSGTVTLIKTAVGGDGTFSFSGSDPALSTTLQTVGGSASSGAIALPPGSYTVTEAAAAGFSLTNLTCTDPDGGTTTNLATRTAAIDLDPGENVTCMFTNTGLGSNVVLGLRVVGGEGSLSFTSTASALAVTLNSVGGAADTAPIALGPGAYTVIANQPSGYAISDITCSDADGGSAVDLASASAEIDLDAGETVTCIFTLLNSLTQTQAVIRSFLHNRLNALLEEEPDRPRFIRRFPGSLWGDGGGPGGSSPVELSFSGSGTVAFSTSLSRIARYGAQVDDATRREAGQGAMLLGSKSARSPATWDGIDVWVEGHYTGYNSRYGDVDGDGSVGIFYLGADYPLTPDLLIGFLTQFDWAEEDSDSLGSHVEGRGWMAGPYLSARLRQNLFLDLRAAWGRSDNEVDPFGLYTDDFDTTRWLAIARLSGNWRSGAMRVTPSVSVKYGQEHQESYTDSMGVLIPDQTVSLGRVEFGPEFAYRHRRLDGTLIEPQLKLTGIWDFENDGGLTLDGDVTTPDELRAKVEAGVLVQMTSGWSLRATGSYDGIGADDYEAYSAKLWLNVPLN